MTTGQVTKSRISDIIFILWAGGAALLSYSLIYALRKPYTAAAFDGLELLGFDYKVAATTIQIIGYLTAKFIGIKLISELKKEHRFRFFVISVVIAQCALLAFGFIPAPYNAFALFFNGLFLGCIWGVIFSFIEGRRVTDILASLLGVSIVVSSGTAKSIGLYVMNDWGVSQFWMPALIGAVALPILIALAWALNRLPQPNETDISCKSERVALNSESRKSLFKNYMPFLILILTANFLLVMLRDIKEDFLINIIDMEGQSSWLFTQVDSVVTLIILALFGFMIFVRSNIKVMFILLTLVITGTITMTYISLNYETLSLSPTVWLFIQSLCLYVAFLTFQTVFFDRFIACFKIKGNVGYFIALIDFIGYTGTVAVLLTKELLNTESDWFKFYNQLAACVGIVSSAAFVCATIMLAKKYRSQHAKTSINMIHNEKLIINTKTI